MTDEQKLLFRDQLRDARAVALKDAEAFDAIVYVIERLGRFLYPGPKLFPTLADLKSVLCDVAVRSPLAQEITSDDWKGTHLDFSTLYELVREGRNTAMHEGAYARHLTAHTVELSIILEHALMNGLDKVQHFMVRNPVCAAMWQPLSFIRQSMLANSFSYLPVLVKQADGHVWSIVSDYEVARHLRGATGGDLHRRLKQPLEEAVKASSIKLHKARIFKPEDSVKVLFKEHDGLPVLVCSGPSDNLLGIITAFDLL